MKKLMKNRVKTMIVVFTFLFVLSLVIGLIFYFKQDKEIRYSLVSGVGDLKELLKGDIRFIILYLLFYYLIKEEKIETTNFARARINKKTNSRR